MPDSHAPASDATSTVVAIRPVGTADLSQVAETHQAAFERSSLTRLGRSAVCGYYAWQLEGPHECVALGALVGDRIVGFLFGGIFKGALSGFVRRNPGLLVRSLALRPWLLADRAIWSDGMAAVGILARRRPSTTADAQMGHLRSFGILALAVVPDMQRHGVGRALMVRAEDAARRGGFTRMHLSVDPENQGAVGFYRALGWELDGGAAGSGVRMSRRLEVG